MLLLYSGLLSVFWSIVFYRMFRGLYEIEDLPSHLPLPEKPPLVSVIIAAKEEQETIGETVKHLLRQSYPRLEIIAVNDRSKDATGGTLEALKAWSAGKEHSNVPLKVIHIKHLPEGWLGKNHALYQGYLQSNGSYLLFTDADVRFHPNAIRDAVSYAVRERIDHVTLSPKMVSRTLWLRAFVNFFMYSLFIRLSPWIANRDEQRRVGVGIGAFNLLRRGAYETIGTHCALQMRPDDDLQLGTLVKNYGLRQRIAIGARRISVEWYTSLREAVRGLEKNFYSGFGYRLSLAVAAALGQLAFFAVPFALLFFARGLEWLLIFANAAAIAATYLLCTRRINKEPGWEALLLPFSSLLLVYILLRSVWLAHRRAGVYWRGTFYTLRDLRRLYK